MIKFRFQDLDVWKDAIGLCNELFDVAEVLEARKWFRFADQVRSAALSTPNNIAEGSGADTKPEFSRLLGYARRSLFENATMVFVLHGRGLLDEPSRDGLLEKCDSISGRIASLQKSLRA